MDAVNCPQCNNKATWINYGPTVGEGYYCRHCKEEVDHHSNTYGISGTRYKAAGRIKLEEKPKLDRDGFVHIAQPFLSSGSVNMQPPLSLIPKYNGQDIQCIKHNCPNCGNKHAGTSILNLKAGQYLYCKSGVGPLKSGNFYKYLNAEPNGIRVEIVDNLGKVQYLSYTACRFQV